MNQLIRVHNISTFLSINPAMSWGSNNYLLPRFIFFIFIQYLCDGADDCDDGYDEDPRLCTAAR